MCMESFKSMKQTLMACAQSQMGHLDKVDAKELGEVIDMIKDLEEAIYYCTITEAMNQKTESIAKEHYYYYTEPYYRDDREKEMERGRMYYTERGRGSKSHDMYGSSNNGDWDSTGAHSDRSMSDWMRDSREGRSHMSRKTYIESRETHQDKAHQLKELEKYMQELTQDMVEMIEDASPEEKQYLEKRISALAQKIGQLK